MSIPLIHEPASNTAAIITIATPAAGVRHEVEGVQWSYDVAPTGGNLKVESPAGTKILSLDITNAGPGAIPLSGSCLTGAAAGALVITLAAGGAGVTGKVNAQQRDK